MTREKTGLQLRVILHNRCNPFNITEIQELRTVIILILFDKLAQLMLSLN